jgi:hypothetical protein
MIQRLALFFTILVIAGLLDGLVFIALARYAHSIGPTGGWILTIVSFILYPPIILSAVANDISPVLFQAIGFLLEVLYLSGVWYLFRKRTTNPIAHADRPPP